MWMCGRSKKNKGKHYILINSNIIYNITHLKMGENKMIHCSYILKKASDRQHISVSIFILFLLSSLCSPIIAGMQAPTYSIGIVTTGTTQGSTYIPVADAGGPYTGRINNPVSFDGSGSHEQISTISTSISTTKLFSNRSTPHLL